MGCNGKKLQALEWWRSYKKGFRNVIWLDQVITKFSMFTRHGRILDDIKSGHKQFGGYMNYLPKIPKFVGDEADFMADVKQLRFFPELIF